MSKDGGPAFPKWEYESCTICKNVLARTDFKTGMSLRDYFAAKAMKDWCEPHSYEQNAKRCWAKADAMLLERNKT